MEKWSWIRIRNPISTKIEFVLEVHPLLPPTKFGGDPWTGSWDILRTKTVRTDRQTDRHTPMTTRPCGLRRADKHNVHEMSATCVSTYTQHCTVKLKRANTQGDHRRKRRREGDAAYIRIFTIRQWLQNLRRDCYLATVRLPCFVQETHESRSVAVASQL